MTLWRKREKKEEGGGRGDLDLGNQFSSKEHLGGKVVCLCSTMNVFQRHSPKHSLNVHKATSSVRTCVHYPHEALRVTFLVACATDHTGQSLLFVLPTNSQGKASPVWLQLMAQLRKSFALPPTFITCMHII